MFVRASLLSSLLIATLSGCSGPSRTAPATADTAPPPAPPAVCDGAAPGAEALAALALGETLEDPKAPKVWPWPLADREQVLAPLLPGLAGQDVWAVTAIEAVANDRLELAVLTSPTGSGEDNDMGDVYRPVHLVVLRCQDGAGWVAAAPPFEISSSVVAAHLIDADAVSLASGATATAVRVRQFGGLFADEFIEYAYLIGGPEPGYKVEPADAPVGSLGIVATTGRFVHDFNEGEEVMYGSQSYRASGWLPAGDGFLYVMLEVMHQIGEVSTAAELTAGGRIGPGGIAATAWDWQPDRAWVLLGTGARPPACDRGAIRCLPGGETLAGFGTLPFDWAAGTWPSAAAAAAVAKDMGLTGTWALIGDPVDEEAEQPEDEPAVLIKGPDGKPARTSAPLIATPR